MATAAEPPLVFFQEPIKTVYRDAIEGAQMTLGLVPKALNAVDVMAAFAEKNLAVVHAAMMKLGHIQNVVNLKAIYVDDAVGGNFLSNDRDKRLGFGV